MSFRGDGETLIEIESHYKHYLHKMKEAEKSELGIVFKEQVRKCPAFACPLSSPPTKSA
jgi:hypothetical protein